MGFCFSPLPLFSYLPVVDRRLCSVRGLQNRGPKMSVTAGGGLGDAPGGRAHHTHLARLARDGLAHLCTDPGAGLALAHALSSPLSAEPSIRFWPDKHPGHSSGSALLRKGTFGAENGPCGIPARSPTSSNDKKMYFPKYSSLYRYPVRFLRKFGELCRLCQPISR